MIKENDIIKMTDDGKIAYIQFKNLLKYKNINHAYVLKTYGMNFRVGTNFRLIESVKNNLKVVADSCGFKYETFIRPDYNHTNNVSVINEVDISSEVPELRGTRFKDTDGLATNKKDITLMSTNADCNLVLLYDPVNDVIANVHAGWRGTFDRIVTNAGELMKKEFNCNPKNIEAYLCPSIRKCHFEVDEDVCNLCKEAFKDCGKLDKIIFKGDIKNEKQKYFIDTVYINKMLLEECGVLPNNIFDSGVCSVCESEQVHSKRAEGDLFGLGAAFITKE